MSIFLLENSHTHELRLPDSCLKAVTTGQTKSEKIECDYIINKSKDKQVVELLNAPHE